MKELTVATSADDSTASENDAPNGGADAAATGAASRSRRPSWVTWGGWRGMIRWQRSSTRRAVGYATQSAWASWDGAMVATFETTGG